MARTPREKSKTGIYHIILRGTNRQEIFHEDDDRIRFLETLKRYKEETKINVYGWCLMDNHIHLLLRESAQENIGMTMKRLAVSFVCYYNKKYKTIGHLFQDRFKSEKVDTDAYLLTVVRYIHQNPVKAGIVQKSYLWKWSSCLGYYGENYYPDTLLDEEFILNMFYKQKLKAIELFKEFNEQDNADKCLEDIMPKNITDDELKDKIKEIIPNINIISIKTLEKTERNEVLKKIKKIEGITQRQLARVIGISQGLISRV